MLPGLPGLARRRRLHSPAVKTQRRLLVFDAEEFGVVRPTDPCLANGFLSAEELADQNLLGLYTCYHGDPGELAYVHELADEVSGAAYVHLEGDRFRDGPNCLYLAGGDRREIDGATVRTIDAATGMPTHAYLVEADGVTLYYQGFYVEDPDGFRRDVAALTEQVGRVDMAFLPIPDLKNETRFPDVIGVGGASNGEHGPWQIPYGALVPETIDNVLAAGRCISAEMRMADLVRLIPNCFVTGHAAGVAAAVAVQDDCLPRTVDVAKVQKILREQEAYLG